MADKKTWRIGVLGLTHDHVWGNLAALAAADNGELVAAADPNGPLLEKVRELYGCAVYADHQEMLARERLDAVYVYGDNATGAELAALAAGRGLHVMVEKPMAADLAGADRMLAAAEQAGVRLMVNWPFAWWPQLQTAIEIALSGRLGRLWHVKYRAAHAGPREVGCSEYFCRWLYDARLNGAGALMDYCCYGAVLARALMGPPRSVVAVAGRFCKDDIDVEDNAILVMSYARGMATAEASWTQTDKLTSYTTVLYGTDATLMVEPRAGGRLWQADAESPDGIEVDVPPPPPHQADSAAHFLWGIETGEEFLPPCRPRESRDAQEALQAGLISARTGHAVELPVS
jgi:predicted dehydrogenase